MTQANIAICSLATDFHALIIKAALDKKDDIVCHIVETDRVCGSGSLSWTNIPEYMSCRLPSSTGTEIDVSTLDAIWWRRGSRPQEKPEWIDSPADADLIDRDSRDGLLGLLLSRFRGTWISHPKNQTLAENKILQLDAAQRSGFHVPRTLVSNDGPTVRHFAAMLGGEVIAKPVRGTHKASVYTVRLKSKDLSDDVAIRLCPAIYQEYIEGRHHLRVQCFGDKVYAALIDSPNLDWRKDLNGPLITTEIDESLKTALQSVLADLGLRMGIVDLKLDESGNPVWLEINPQGQFLFVQGLCGLDLIRAFTDFIASEARQAAARRRNSDNRAGRH